MHTKNIDLTKEIALVTFNADMCSCERITKDLEVNKDGKAVQKGTKVSIPVFNTDHTKPLKKNRERIRRYLQSVGINFAGAFIIPKEEVDTVIAQTNKYVDDFNRERDILMQNYDTHLQDFIDSYEVDALKPIIQGLTYSADVFASKHFLEMLPPMSLNASNPEEQDKLLDSIGKAAFDDVRQNALSIYKDRLLVGTPPKLVSVATQTVVKDLVTLKEKVTKLSFLHEGFGNLIRGFSDVLASLPKTGKIENHHLSTVVNLLHTLRDEDLIRDLADGHSQVTVIEPDDSWIKSDSETTAQETTINAAATATDPEESFDQTELFDDWD